MLPAASDAACSCLMSCSIVPCLSFCPACLACLLSSWCAFSCLPCAACLLPVGAHSICVENMLKLDIFIYVIKQDQYDDTTDTYIQFEMGQNSQRRGGLSPISAALSHQLAPRYSIFHQSVPVYSNQSAAVTATPTTNSYVLALPALGL
ncbi:hypothetical protein GWK47_054532 [Chionoecetes opilio]|uniref:Uncharacterized protein n=1 Tax=Chionoecetes opilio TaxID=41210 RepID=A0A8J5CPX8_CHIOP|nr:hypothetical protein GWK47_054532 [Chionoecetes opilio]